MNSKQAISVLFAALGLAFSSTATSQGSNSMVDIKTSGELRELFSNKTFKGSNWTAYYRSDGKGLLIDSRRKPEPATWKIKGEDQVCVTFAGAYLTSTICYRYQQHKQNRAWFTQIDVASHGSNMFTLKDGIPKF